MIQTASEVRLVVPASYEPICDIYILGKMIDEHDSWRIADIYDMFREIEGSVRGVSGLNPDLLIALSAVDTDYWRSGEWRDNLAQTGGKQVAHDMAVRLMTYAKGHDNAMKNWVSESPPDDFLSVHINGHAGTVKRLSGLGNGKWSPKSSYKLEVLAVINEMERLRNG